MHRGESEAALPGSMEGDSVQMNVEMKLCNTAGPHLLNQLARTCNLPWWMQSCGTCDSLLSAMWPLDTGLPVSVPLNRPPDDVTVKKTFVAIYVERIVFQWANFKVSRGWTIEANRRATSPCSIAALSSNNRRAINICIYKYVFYATPLKSDPQPIYSRTLLCDANTANVHTQPG